MKYSHLAARLYNAPLLVHPDKATVIEQVFRSHLLGEAKPAANPEDYQRPEAALGTLKYRDRGNKPYSVTEGGVAILPVIGTLVQRAGSLDAMSGLIGYNRLERQLAAMIDDADVKGIVLEVDSPGGEANGCFDLARRIVEARGAKPIWAVANEQAFSAAYALACAAQRLVVPPTGLVGSVGVIAMHVDQSKRDSQQGYSYTAVYAGARKNDFSSHAPLSPKAEAALQAEVDRLYEIFVTHVAAARGIDAKAVRATEAGLLDPELAKRGGFIDAIAGFPETVAELEVEVRRPRLNGVVRQVAQPKVAPAASAIAPTTVSARFSQELTAALFAQALARAKTRGHAGGAAECYARAYVREVLDERARVMSILEAREAVGRTAMARFLATETDIAPDEARAMLARTPIEAAGINASFVGADVVDADCDSPRIDSAMLFESRRKH
ncbi:MAG: S49 family peptidase [Burkholderiales bacterium]